MVKKFYQFVCGFLKLTTTISIDFRFLERITGQCIAENILHVLELHNIEI